MIVACQSAEGQFTLSQSLEDTESDKDMFGESGEGQEEKQPMEERYERMGEVKSEHGGSGNG